MRNKLAKKDFEMDCEQQGERTKTTRKPTVVKINVQTDCTEEGTSKDKERKIAS